MDSQFKSAQGHYIPLSLLACVDTLSTRLQKFWLEQDRQIEAALQYSLLDQKSIMFLSRVTCCPQIHPNEDASLSSLTRNTIINVEEFASYLAPFDNNFPTAQTSTGGVFYQEITYSVYPYFSFHIDEEVYICDAIDRTVYFIGFRPVSSIDLNAFFNLMQMFFYYQNYLFLPRCIGKFQVVWNALELYYRPASEQNVSGYNIASPIVNSVLNFPVTYWSWKGFEEYTVVFRTDVIYAPPYPIGSPSSTPASIPSSFQELGFSFPKIDSTTHVPYPHAIKLPNFSMYRISTIAGAKLRRSRYITAEPPPPSLPPLTPFKIPPPKGPKYKPPYSPSTPSQFGPSPVSSIMNPIQPPPLSLSPTPLSSASSSPLSSPRSSYMLLSSDGSATRNFMRASGIPVFVFNSKKRKFS